TWVSRYMEIGQPQLANTTYSDTARGYLQTATEQPAENTCLWADAPASSSGYDTWQADITAGGGDGWGDSIDQSAFSPDSVRMMGNRIIWIPFSDLSCG
ncbi:MAG: hypothetical protein ACK56F_15690, partial [bacterium]